jgi:hypothetical protein
MNDATTTIERYIAVWNETDPANRQALIAATWSDDAIYRDPMMAGDGAAGIDAMIAGVQARFPGLVFRLTGPVDAHGAYARFTWTAGAGPDAEPVIAGTDFAELAEDGRLASVVGFLDLVPAALA